MNQNEKTNQNETQTHLNKNQENEQLKNDTDTKNNQNNQTKQKKLTLKEKMLQKKLKKNSKTFQPSQQKKQTNVQPFQSQRTVTNPTTNTMTAQNQMQMTYGQYPQYFYNQQQYNQMYAQQRYQQYSNQTQQYYNNAYAQMSQNPYNQYYYNSQRNIPQNNYYQQQYQQQTQQATQQYGQKTQNINVKLPDKKTEEKEEEITKIEDQPQEKKEVTESEKQDQKKSEEKKQIVEESQKQEKQKQEEETPQKKQEEKQEPKQQEKQEPKQVEKQEPKQVEKKQEEKKPQEQEPKQEQPKQQKLDPNHITEQQIEDFIKNYTGKLSEEYQHLDYTIIEVEVSKGGKYGKSNKNQKGGNFEVNKPSKNKYKYHRDNQKRDQNPPKELARKKVSEETLKKIKEIKESASAWGYMKKNEDENVQAIKKMKALLNKLTADNFQKVSKQILDCAKNQQVIEPMIENLVRKAWNEPRYTKCYAELVVVLTKQNFSWDKSKKNKSIRKKVLNLVENEYVEGFSKYQEYSQQVQKNEEYDAQEKKDLLQIKKKQLLGNINFICELYEQKVLNFKIFKMIILYGLKNFIKEYIRTETEQDKFSIKEDYLEALMRIFQNSGLTIEKNELKQIKKKQEQNPKFQEDSTQREELFEDFKYMIDKNIDYTKDYSEKEYLDQISSNCFKISILFFDFLKYIQKKNLSIRMDSLIQNLIEYRDSKYTQKIQKISAAKKLSDIQKDIQMKKQEEEENLQNYYDDQRYQESYKRDKNYQSFRKKGRYQKNNYENGEQYQKKSEYQKKKELTSEDIEKKIKKFCEENKGFTEEQFEQFMNEKLGSNNQMILTVFFETFCLHATKIQIDKKKNYALNLLKNQKLTPQQFVSSLEKSFIKLYCEFTDLPYLLPAIVDILYTAIQENLLTSKDLMFDKKPSAIPDEDELEEYLYFIESFVDEAKKIQSKYNLNQYEIQKWYSHLKNQ